MVNRIQLLWESRKSNVNDTNQMAIKAKKRSKLALILLIISDLALKIAYIYEMVIKF